MVGARDISTCDNNDDEVSANILDTISGTVFVLGDKLYPDGTIGEFTDCNDPTWGDIRSGPSRYPVITNIARLA